MTKLPPRFDRLVPDRPTDGCWPWAGPMDRKGYGAGYRKGLRTTAHRIVYLEMVGPIPEGMELDHLCRNRACVNPAHMEPITHAENIRRSMPFRIHPTHCPQGHAFDEANTYVVTRKDGIARHCRACKNRHRTARRALAAAAASVAALLLVSTAALAHTASPSCESLTIRDRIQANPTADIIHQGTNVVVWNDVLDGTYAVPAGTYKVFWSDGVKVHNLGVGACPQTPSPSPSPSATPTASPTPSPTPTTVPSATPSVPPTPSASPSATPRSTPSATPSENPTLPPTSVAPGTPPIPPSPAPLLALLAGIAGAVTFLRRRTRA